MSKKNNETQNANGASLGLGEISTIRNILMGQQINEFESRFGELEKRINKMEDTLLDRIDELKEMTQATHDSFARETDQQFVTFDKRMEKEIAELERKLVKTTTKERLALGKMLGDVSKKLLGE